MGQEMQPQTDESDAVERLYIRPSRTAGAPVLTRHGAVRSWHWRLWLGLFELVSALLTGYVTFMNAAPVIGQIQDMGASGVQPPGEWIAAVFAIISGFSVVSIAGTLIGIWNFATVKTTARSPLIAAIVVSAASIVMMMVFFSGSPFDPVKIGWCVVHALVIVGTVGTLRLKKIPAP